MEGNHQIQESVNMSSRTVILIPKHIKSGQIIHYSTEYILSSSHKSQDRQAIQHIYNSVATQHIIISHILLFRLPRMS